MTGFTSWLSGLISREDTPPQSRIADKFADVEVVNQFGTELRFHRDLVADRALIVTPIYTRCRGTCPTTGATLQQLRSELSPIFGDQLSIVSFSIEPKVDTVQVLRRYAARFKADEPNDQLCDWHFLTGDAEDMDQLRRSLNFYDLDPRVDQDVTQHDALLLFGNDRTDRWSALPASLRHGHILETIRRVAGFSFEQKYGIPE